MKPVVCGGGAGKDSKVPSTAWFEQEKRGSRLDQKKKVMSRQRQDYDHVIKLLVIGDSGEYDIHATHARTHALGTREREAEQAQTVGGGGGRIGEPILVVYLTLLGQAAMTDSCSLSEISSSRSREPRRRQDKLAAQVLRGLVHHELHIDHRVRRPRPPARKTWTILTAFASHPAASFLP